MKARIVLIIGVLLVLVSAAWPYLWPKGMLWDDARAVELTNAAEALHETMHAHGTGHDHDHFGDADADDPPEVIAASKKYRAVEGDLNFAKFWTNSMPIYFRWIGLAVCVVGIAAYFASRTK
jgi:hypothetical protein